MIAGCLAKEVHFAIFISVVVNKFIDDSCVATKSTKGKFKDDVGAGRGNSHIFIACKAVGVTKRVGILIVNHFWRNAGDFRGVNSHIS